MDQDDPEKRIADLEHQLAELKRDADLRPAHHGVEMPFPSQTPGYRRRKKKKETQLLLISMVMVVAFAAGLCIILFGLDPPDQFPGGPYREDGPAPSVVWLGVAMMVLSVLIPVPFVIKANVRNKKDSALREQGTVQVLTVASSRHYHGDAVYSWELTSEMHIRLDNGHTFRGSYFATVWEQWMRRTRRYVTPDGVTKIRPRPERYIPHFDEWFRVGASWRCHYNPANPDKLVVFPFTPRGDRVKDDGLFRLSSDSVVFYSAT